MVRVTDSKLKGLVRKFVANYIKQGKTEGKMSRYNGGTTLMEAIQTRWSKVDDIPAFTALGYVVVLAEVNYELFIIVHPMMDCSLPRKVT